MNNPLVFYEILALVKKLALGDIIDGIRRRDNKVLTIIYKDFYPGISTYIRNNGGTTDDAKDVFQESLIIIFRQIEEKSLEIKTEFENYLFGIARLIWLKIIRNRDIHNRSIAQLEDPEAAYHPADEIIEEDFELRIFRKHFLEMGEEGQKLLKLSASDISNDAIAQMLGYKNEQVVRNMKYKFKEKLIQRIKTDPEYIRFLNSKK
jgi:RNA polymerase sigma factor (sigma-70 family)